MNDTRKEGTQMKKRLGKTVVVAVAALSIASVGTASAKQGADGVGKGPKVDRPSKGQNGKGQNGKGPVKKGQQYNFHGTYVGVEGLEAGQISVTVTNGNRWVKRSGLIGQTVVFDVSTAMIKVADVNTDGSSNLSDVVVGDAVLVTARLPRLLPLTPPLKAWKLVDKTNPPVEDSPEAPETEIPG
jgi:hypothetical protein